MTEDVESVLLLFDGRISRGDSAEAALLAVSAKLLVTEDDIHHPRQALAIAREIIRQYRNIDIEKP